MISSLFPAAPGHSSHPAVGSAVIHPAPGQVGHARTATWATPESALVGLMRRVLDELDYGVVIVDAQAEVSFINRTARAEHTSAGLQNLMVGDRLSAGTPLETGELMRAVRDAAQLSRRSLVRLGTGMRHCIAVVPLGSDTGTLDSSGGQALLLFGRRQVCAPISIAFFARTFGLTPTETQVLEALCQGEPPARIAAINGVAVSTIRTQLTAIRQKTQTGSLRELVRQVSTLPPIVCLSFGDATH
jgi:DNA-binding CsgD family transcriptional regulator